MVEGPLRRLLSFISRVSRCESRRLFLAESEELARATEIGDGSSNSSRACMRFALGLMKDGGGKVVSCNGESGSGCAEAGGALPFMLDAVVSRAGADFRLENSLSSLSNPLAMMGGGEGGLGGFVRNLYCQLHSILAELAGAVHCSAAPSSGQSQWKCSTYRAEDYVAVGSVVAGGMRPYKRSMISLFDRQWALSRRLRWGRA